jgi:hypothetical protein
VSKHLSHAEKLRFNSGNVGEKNIVPSKDENLFAGPCASRDATQAPLKLSPTRLTNYKASIRASIPLLTAWTAPSHNRNLTRQQLAAAFKEAAKLVDQAALEVGIASPVLGRLRAIFKTGRCRGDADIPPGASPTLETLLLPVTHLLF